MMNTVILDVKYPRPDRKDPEITRWDPAGTVILQFDGPEPENLKCFGQVFGHGDISAFVRKRKDAPQDKVSPF